MAGRCARCWKGYHTVRVCAQASDDSKPTNSFTSFHCVYWPAFLMALDLPLPNNVLVHGHWTINREKMSKSTGNMVDPFFAIDRFGVDTIRFFLALHGDLTRDANYDNHFIIDRYKKWLQGGIGNLTSRVIGICSKGGGNLSAFLANAAEGKLPFSTSEDLEFQLELEELPVKVGESMKGLDPYSALSHIVDMIKMVSDVHT